MQPAGDVNDPYNAPKYNVLFSGACRCFLHRQTAMRQGSVKDSDFRIVVPDRSMPDVGENYRVCVKMHTSKNNRYWDLVGYVADFARYDRVCNIDFQMVKENQIYEDIPGPVINVEKRELESIEYDGFVLEGICVTQDRIIKACAEPVTIAVERSTVEVKDFHTYICEIVEDEDETEQYYMVSDLQTLNYERDGYKGLIMLPEHPGTYYFVVTTETVKPYDNLVYEPIRELEFVIKEE